MNWPTLFVGIFVLMGFLAVNDVRWKPIEPPKQDYEKEEGL